MGSREGMTQEVTQALTRLTATIDPSKTSTNILKYTDWMIDVVGNSAYMIHVGYGFGFRQQTNSIGTFQTVLCRFLLLVGNLFCWQRISMRREGFSANRLAVVACGFRQT